MKRMLFNATQQEELRVAIVVLIICDLNDLDKKKVSGVNCGRMVS